MYFPRKFVTIEAMFVYLSLGKELNKTTYSFYKKLYSFMVEMHHYGLDTKGCQKPQSVAVSWV